MAFGVAVTLGVTSVVLFLTNGDDSPPKSSNARHKPMAKKNPVKIVPTPFFVPNGGGAGALLRF